MPHHTQRMIFAFIVGGLFGLGLMVSGMTDTDKVQGWLDIFGQWDPTLAFVMGGAIIPMVFAWRFSEKHLTAHLGTQIPAKPAPIISKDLIIGSALFGFGWALVGLCPGPAMAALSYGGAKAFAFFIAMIAGMTLFGLSTKRRQP